MLSRPDIREALACGDIAIDPLTEKAMQVSSVDVTLGNEFSWAMEGDDPVDPYDEASIAAAFSPFVTLRHRFLLRRGECLLAVTKECVTISPCLAVQVDGKSGLGRLFIKVHQTAGFADAGFVGHVTLEMTNGLPRPVWIYPGMKIGQLKVFRLDTPADGVYQGGYVGAAMTTAPQLSRYWATNERPQTGG